MQLVLCCVSRSDLKPPDNLRFLSRDFCAHQTVDPCLKPCYLAKHEKMEVGMRVEWAKKPGGEWFTLDESVEAAGLNRRGVYIIWIPSALPARPGTVLKVGSGNLAVRLAFERTDPYVYKSPQPLVTWAEVDSLHHRGLVSYLTHLLEPAFFWEYEQSTVEPIQVNAPLLA
jgi:hypothetical protein